MHSKSTSLPAGGVAGRPARRIFMKQANMLRVVYCLLAVAGSAIYFFGWRVASVLAVALMAGLITEFITSRGRGKPISMACLVTCMLYSLALPPTAPYLVVVVGAVVAILFGKEVFGGFGQNFVNPAILGRAFVYVCFPVELTGKFVPAFGGFPGGFARWSFQSLSQLPADLTAGGEAVVDAVSQASPLWVFREYGIDAAEGAFSWIDIMFGSISGVFTAGDSGVRILSAGSTGEGCAVIIVLAAVYLLITKTANWRLMLFSLLGLIGTNLLWRNLCGFDGVGEVPPLWMNLLGGTTMYVLVFMVTDPVSAPKKKLAQIWYGLLIGFLIVTLRWLGVFVAAATFAVLLGNIAGPLLDLGAEGLLARKKAAKAATSE